MKATERFLEAHEEAIASVTLAACVLVIVCVVAAVAWTALGK